MNTKESLEKSIGLPVKEKEILASKTTLKIGGPADYFVEVSTVDQLIGAIVTARALSLDYFVLGGGSNILVSDKGYRGLVIKNNTRKIVIRGAKGVQNAYKKGSDIYLETESGVLMNSLVRFTLDEGLKGLEMHLGLPGTVGGAIYMNSKWSHPVGYVGDVVYQATILTRDNKVNVVAGSYFNFGYDYSRIQETREVVLSVVFRLTQVQKEELWNVANKSIAYRRESQPQGIKSAGCTFQNVFSEDDSGTKVTQTTSVGQLLDKAGLKGVSRGNAEISRIHANFIVNNDHASASDVVELIELARKTIKDRFGINCKEEIIRVGDF